MTAEQRRWSADLLHKPNGGRLHISTIFDASKINGSDRRQNVVAVIRSFW